MDDLNEKMECDGSLDYRVRALEIRSRYVHLTWQETWFVSVSAAIAVYLIMSVIFLLFLRQCHLL